MPSGPFKSNHSLIDQLFHTVPGHPHASSKLSSNTLACTSRILLNQFNNPNTIQITTSGRLWRKRIWDSYRKLVRKNTKECSGYFLLPVHSDNFKRIKT